MNEIKHRLIYSESTNTIRLLPENYGLAYFFIDQKVWICRPGLAADKDICVALFREMMEFDNLHKKDPTKLLDRMNNSIKVAENQFSEVEKFRDELVEKLNKQIINLKRYCRIGRRN